MLLPGCAHNPTGIDPTREQWEQIADLVIEKNHLPFFDVVRCPAAMHAAHQSQLDIECTARDTAACSSILWCTASAP